MSRHTLGRARRQARGVDQAAAGHRQPLARHRAAHRVHQRAGRELRQVADERHDPIVLGGVHHDGPRAQRLHERAQPCHGPASAPAAASESTGGSEQVAAREAEPAPLGAANRMAADEPGARRQPPRRADDVALGAADVGDDARCRARAPAARSSSRAFWRTGAASTTRSASPSVGHRRQRRVDGAAAARVRQHRRRDRCRRRAPTASGRGSPARSTRRSGRCRQSRRGETAARFQATTSLVLGSWSVVSGSSRGARACPRRCCGRWPAR